MGRNVSMLMPTPYHEQHDGYIQRYLTTRTPHIIGIGREVVGRRQDGSTFPMDLAVSEVGDQDNPHFVGIIRDLSERKYLEKALVSASENERREIGRDLHDALGQIITGISLLAKSLAKKLAAKGDPLAEDAEAMAGLSAEAMTETKRLAYGAFPTELERRGLQVALEQILEHTRRLHGIETRLEAPAEWASVGREIELHLYRIAQESVANAIKHGQPRRLAISLQRDAGELCLRIEDDGTGLPPTRDPDRVSMGLDIMRHRAALIGGTLCVGNRPGGGVEVRCCVPASFLVSTNT
jgi:signal transduction histidine kinase